MSTLNRNVDIMGHTVSVKEEALPADLAGDSNNCTLAIRISSALPDAVKVETFYHEVVHLMFSFGGYGDLLDEKMEEALAQYLGHAMAQFISVNGSLPIIDKEAV